MLRISTVVLRNCRIYIRYVSHGQRAVCLDCATHGRTKDGNDVTDQGLIKMFCMSCPEDKIKAIDQLHVVPIAVSYEWEPCDILKTLELYESQFFKSTQRNLEKTLTAFSQDLFSRREEYILSFANRFLMPS